jgi:hypothetical protein
MRFAFPLVLLVCACSKKTVQDTVREPAIDVAALANAAVPEAAKGTLVFENVKVSSEGRSIRFARPKGWIDVPGGGKFSPSTTSPFVSMQAGHGCGGLCTPKDWKPVVEKAMKAFIQDGPNTHEEALPNNGRIRWDVNSDTAHVIATWWKEGDSNYRHCTVWLHQKDLVKSVAAFAAVCRNLQVE